MFRVPWEGTAIMQGYFGFATRVLRKRSGKAERIE